MANLTDNERTWAKTLLIIYPRTKRILQALSETRMKIALDGFSSVGVDKLFDRVADLNYRMEGITNLYVLAKNALSAVGVIHSEILIMRHVRAMSVPDIAELLNTSVRNVYRKYDRALETFYRVLETEGRGAEWLEKEYASDHLVTGIHRRADASIFADRRHKKRRSARTSVAKSVAREPDEGRITA